MNRAQIKMLQSMLNRLGITDYLGHTLITDGIMGKCTNSAIAKVKPLLKYVLK